MIKRRGSRGHRVPVIIVFFSILGSQGCFRVPKPAAPEIQSPQGAGVVDPSQIRAGQTTRADVYRDWGWSDVLSGEDRLFIGKLRFSNEKGLEVNGPIIYAGGRQWSDINLFVEFDANGVVTKSYLTPDRVRGIASWTITNRDLPPIELSHPIELRTRIRTGESGHIWAEQGVIVLATDAIEFRSEDHKNRSPVRCALEQVAELTDHENVYSDSSGSHTLYGQRLIFRGVPGWTKVTLDLATVDAVILVRYIKQVRESALPR